MTSQRARPAIRRTSNTLQELSSGLDPCTIALGGRDAGFHKGNTLHAVLDCRINDVLVDLPAIALGDDCLGGLGVDGGETFEIAFRMARGDAADATGSRAGACTVAGDQLASLAEFREPQIVGVGLHPFDAALG